MKVVVGRDSLPQWVVEAAYQSVRVTPPGADGNWIALNLDLANDLAISLLAAIQSVEDSEARRAS